jgi:mannose-6-phosphate isomerase-like protein (cupin superfamily)
MEVIMEKVSLDQKFALFSEQWKPKIVGELNGQHVKLGKIEGSFVWHQHEKEDELFLVVKGSMRLEFSDNTVDVGEGEFIIVPHGIQHRPVADKECHILIFEPASTLNTGNVEDAFTVEEPEWI